MPVVTSPLTATGIVNKAFSYTATATNMPTGWTATPLPPGLTVNATTGVISGTPSATGTTNVVLTGSNANGAGPSSTLVITVDPPLPVINSPSTATGTVNSSFTYQITASSSPTSFGESGALPAGLTFNSTTGVISGTPTATGTTTVSLTATNGSGTSTPFSLAITINTAQVKPSMISVNAAFGTVGKTFNYVTSATNSPTSYSETGALPAGLSPQRDDGRDHRHADHRGCEYGEPHGDQWHRHQHRVEPDHHHLCLGCGADDHQSDHRDGRRGFVLHLPDHRQQHAHQLQLDGYAAAGLTFSTAKGTITGTPTATGTASVAPDREQQRTHQFAHHAEPHRHRGHYGYECRLNQSATGSSFQAGNGYAGADDGNTSTRWAAANGNDPQYWEVDLGASKTLSRVDINWYTNASRYTQYNILTSTDGVTWTNQVDKSSNVTDGATSDTFPTTVPAHYVIVNTTNVSSGFASAYEIQVYGH